MNILICLAYCQENAPQTERLLDFIYRLNQKSKKYHLVLAHSADVHAENKQRIGISAELAFEKVYPVEVRTLADSGATKFQKINNAFRQVSLFVEEGFNWPFLWMEPDCTPTNPDWFNTLLTAYSGQPRPYFGTQMKLMVKEGEAPNFMARNGIYSNRTNSELFATDQQGPFEVVKAASVIKKFNATKLIQQLPIKSEEDIAKVRSDAALVHGDKNQLFLNSIKTEPKTVEITSTPEVQVPVAIATDQTPRMSRRQIKEMEAARNGNRI